jgi:hypothetical protein
MNRPYLALEPDLAALPDRLGAGRTTDERYRTRAQQPPQGAGCLRGRRRPAWLAEVHGEGMVGRHSGGT